MILPKEGMFSPAEGFEQARVHSCTALLVQTLHYSISQVCSTTTDDLDFKAKQVQQENVICDHLGDLHKLNVTSSVLIALWT